MHLIWSEQYKLRRNKKAKWINIKWDASRWDEMRRNKINLSIKFQETNYFMKQHETEEK